ncbi:ABC transporter ATP-binding protein [Streptomyces sp. VRA16 Mangrove soil]|uniref:ABC transporter ATP-binding protein n=1 Tax=Streptomyces sp. VRA16 Mangrove soil TaxID=2817434 RepID=UPI001A9EB729|nr:ABC transporter ATP-binding protein [Streptomyces sp. VRA16 Mangrove soil]MBO1329775.1 ABC transporter ATP-binding protein [Streptomyces sp. VRA16 Mangrove soil]
MDVHKEAEPLLDVRDLGVEFSTRAGRLRAVDGVSWTLRRGRTLAILGESGSGKSVSTQAITGILDSPPGEVTGGQALFDGMDLLRLTARERRGVVGSRISLVFQDALSALNPVHTVGRQIAELYRVHRGTSRKDAMRQAADMLDRVGIPGARARVHDYPHQFSGGMRQRVMIAMALALGPEVLIADEPTTALDVTVQAQILELLAESQADTDMGVVLITHDLGVAAEIADDLVVMYAGRVVESGPTADVLGDPQHPYTQGLLESVPTAETRGQELPAIPGTPPDLLRLPSGCPFRPRCPHAHDRCTTERPELVPVPAGPRFGACHLLDPQLSPEGAAR